MKKTRIGHIALLMLAAFLLWTLAVCFIDVEAIGPNGTTVGFSTVNKFVHSLTGDNMTLYAITDWLELVPIAFVIGLAFFGLAQWIKRKRLSRVDRSILILGVFYITVMVLYLLFEEVVINYRPILINGNLETSYPSSTTLLVACVMPTAVMQLNFRIKNVIIKKSVTLLITAFIVFMILGRLISGVHWLSDIVGGVLLSAGLVLGYYSICKF